MKNGKTNLDNDDCVKVPAGELTNKLLSKIIGRTEYYESIIIID